jgi:hypothetical protein
MKTFMFYLYDGSRFKIYAENEALAFVYLKQERPEINYATIKEVQRIR